MMHDSKGVARLFAAPFAIWAAIFIVLPLFFVFYHGLTDGQGAFTLANLWEAVQLEYLQALGLSVELALISTLICLVLAYPLCMILQQIKRGRMLLIFLLFLLPLLGGNKILLIGNIIEQEFTAAYDWQLGSALSMILMVFIILNIVLEAFSGRDAEKDVEQEVKS